MDLMREPGLRAALIVGAAQTVSFDIYVFLLPLLGTAIGLSASVIGLILSSQAVAVMSARLVIAGVPRGTSDWVVLSLAFVAAGGGIAMLGAAQGAVTLIAGSLIFGVAVGVSQPTLLSLLYSLAPKGREAEAIGLRSTFANALHLVIPLAAGGLAAATGITAMVWLLSVMIFGGGGLAWRERARRAID